MPEAVAIISLAINVILVCCTILAGRVAWVHFRGRAVLDWLAQFNTREFFEADEIVCQLVDGQDPATLVDRINAKAEHRVAVTLVLSFVCQAATAARLRLMNRRILSRYAVFIIPYYWEGLKPWVEQRRVFRNEPHLYEDIEWLAGKIKDDEANIFADLSVKER